MLHLLIVDDEYTVVDNLTLTIPWESIGIEVVHSAYSAYEAIEIMQKHDIDIIITDIRMPSMSGLDLIEYVHSSHSQTKCILLSGFGEFEYAQQAIAYKTSDYLLKPVSNETVMDTVSRLVKEIHLEGEETASIRRAEQALKESLPLLQQNLLNDLLQDKPISNEHLTEKLEWIQLPLYTGDEVSIVLVRPEEGFRNYDHLQHPLLEFSINNIAKDIFSSTFHMITCRDIHDYIVYLFKAKPGVTREDLIRFATKFQDSVKYYLKGRVSVVVGNSGIFPTELSSLYYDCLTSLRNRIGNDREFFLIVEDDSTGSSTSLSLQPLYTPPTLIHLLEAGNWKAAEQKIESIFHWLNDYPYLTHEHLLEIYYSIANSFLYLVHKNGKTLDEVLATKLPENWDQFQFQSIDQLYSWTRTVFHHLNLDMYRDQKKDRYSIVDHAKKIINNYPESELSVQMIADQVHVHPNYLSKIYKLETGETLSEYILKIRMDKAAHLLKDPSLKIHHIAHKLGYQNPSYFIKIFRKYFDMTPREYRKKTVKIVELE